MQGVGVVAAEPDGDTMAEHIHGIEIDHRRTHGEGDRLRVENHGSGRSIRGRSQTDDLRIERASCIEVGNLDTDEIGSDEAGHSGCPFRRKRLISGN